MKRAGVLLAVLVLGVAAATAWADRRAFMDPVGDSRIPNLDLVRVTHGHDGGILVHTVKNRGAYDEDACCPEIRIRVGRGREPDFLLAGNRVLRFGSYRVVGRAGFVINGDTIRWRFRARAINNPAKYEWRAIFGTGPRETAPGHYVTHRLR